MNHLLVEILLIKPDSSKIWKLSSEIIIFLESEDTFLKLHMHKGIIIDFGQ